MRKVMRVFYVGSPLWFWRRGNKKTAVAVYTLNSVIGMVVLRQVKKTMAQSQPVTMVTAPAVTWYDHASMN